MKALVTGIGGFCGRHLCRYLAKQGVGVSSIGLRAGGGNHFVIQSINDVPGITEALRAVKPDVIFHLAGAADADDPTLVYLVNVHYALNLFRALTLTGLAGVPVLLVGSAAEYGWVDEKDLPIREDHHCLPLDHYGISKFTQTLIGMTAARAGHRVVVARPGNIVGPGMGGHLVLARAARQVASIIQQKREPIVELGNLETARDFIDVSDVVRIYWQLAQNPAAYGEIVNVCTGNPVGVGSLVGRLIALSGTQIEVLSRSRRFKKWDLPVYSGSTVKLKKLLGWQPRFHTDKSLKAILESFLECHEDSNCNITSIQ
jgi:GDP-4-dehydro-6-deoxy-D-mannose reductase